MPLTHAEWLDMHPEVRGVIERLDRISGLIDRCREILNDRDAGPVAARCAFFLRGVSASLDYFAHAYSYELQNIPRAPALTAPAPSTPPSHDAGRNSSAASWDNPRFTEQ